MISFDEYIAAGGTISNQDEFEALEPHVVDMIDTYIKENVPFWRIKPIQDMHDEMDFTKVVVRQLDYVSQHGGVDAFYGNSDLMFTGATTSGFSYSVDNTKGEMLHNIPFSSLAKSELDYLLLSHGYSGVALW